ISRLEMYIFAFLIGSEPKPKGRVVPWFGQCRGYCAGAIARQRNIPYTVRTMGQLAPWALAQSQLKKRIYTFLIERYNLSHAAAIHCTTPEEAKDVRDFGVAASLITLPLGVSLPADYPNPKTELRQRYDVAPTTPIILFLSRLHYKKRPDLLLQALGQLAAQNYYFHLILAGSGEQSYLDYLQQLIVSLGLSARVTWAGFVTGLEKDCLLQGSDIFVLPSFSENFGIAVAEAMAAGAPVVVTSGVQIAPMIVDSQAGLVVEGRRDSLAEAMAKLLISPELRCQLGKNGRHLVNQQYSWPTIAEKLGDFYASIIDGKRQAQCSI
ncbi:MAG: glycosyltransferase, partial [Leptolyngbyaceae cyanobacterium MO_188.B28]|nr:glycosyltransferase [Leptolyngbyaceae cyanobacterium MO_188.B28]